MWWVTNILPKLDSAVPIDDGPRTISDILDYYDRHGMSGLAERTANGYRAWFKPLKAEFGYLLCAKTLTQAETEPGHLRSAHIAEFLRKNRDDDGGYATHAKRKIATLSSAFNCVMELAIPWTSYNPCLGVKGRSKQDIRTRYIFDDELSAVWKSANKNAQLLIEWIYKTAQRYEDILRLGPNDIHEVDGKRYLINLASKTARRTGKKVFILIDVELQALIDRTIAARPRRIKMAKNLPFFLSEDGTPYTPEGIASSFERARDAAGIEDFQLKDLRAKAATDMYRAGRPLAEISTLLAHSTEEMTHRYIRQYNPTMVVANDSKVWRAA